MTATSPPFRIENDIYQAAKSAASRMHRSASQQLAYWAKLGRELESSDSLSHRDITAVLDGDKAYDSLDPREQAVVRTEWAQRIDDSIENLDLTNHFTARHESYVEMDDAGRLVRHHPDGTEEMIEDKRTSR